MMGDSQEKVLNSYNPGEKDTSFRPENNLFSKISEEDLEKASSKKSFNDKAEAFQGSIKEYYEDYDLKLKTEQKGSKVSNRSEKKPGSNISKNGAMVNAPQPFEVENYHSPTFNKS